MPEVVASAPPTDEAEADAAKSLPKLPVQRTEFGVDVGGANSVGGLRALWRGLLSRGRTRRCELAADHRINSVAACARCGGDF